MRKKSKRPLPTLRREAWKLFSRYIRERDKYICFTCGKKEYPAQAGHYIHRDCLDFNQVNINCQCVRCNKWLHGNSGIYGEKLIKIYGIDAIDELRRKSNEIWKPSRQELEDIIYQTKTILNKMGIIND